MTSRPLVVAVLLALAACGTPSGPVAIPQEQVPFPIRRSAEPPDPGRVTKPYEISFVRRGRLVHVRRDLSTRFPDIEVVARALLDGPTDREMQRGIVTEIPGETRLLSIEVTNSIAEIDLTSEFQRPGPSAGVVLRVAQVVVTLAALESVTAVRFSINGEPIGVPTDDGPPVQRPVRVGDYASVARRR